jgi:PAS domain S-box-containing protein
MSTQKPLDALCMALPGNRNCAILCVGADGAIGFWNAGAEALFGHSPDETLGERVDLIVPDEYRNDALGGI